MLRLLDKEKLDELLMKEKRAIDYRRNGLITTFVGIGLNAFIGIGTFMAGYLYPNTGKELTDAVDEYEKK